MVTRETFRREDWDLNLRAELYKQQFYRTRIWTNGRDGIVDPWVSSITQELDHLRHLKKTERPANVGRIVQEQQVLVLVGYWFDLLEIGPRTHPRTTELVHATISLAGSVSTYFKARFNRVRPWAIAPDLAPPIPSPGLPAYPGGHATQAYLMAKTLAYLVPTKNTQIMDLAVDIARNRERAGLNYPSDTVAGERLAGRIFADLTEDKECVLFQSTLREASDTEWKPGQNPRVGIPRSAALPA